MSTLTAILCNYNHAKLVGRAIDAMLNQSRPPDELIIVDDGSKDDSVSVIESWAAKSPRIHFLKNEKNLGWHLSSAKALAVATGTYVYSAAADDYVLPGFFEKVCGLMDQHPQAGIGCANLVIAQPDNDEVRTGTYQRLKVERCLSADEFVQEILNVEHPAYSLSPATIYRRDELQKIGGWRIDLGPWSDTFSIVTIAAQTGLSYVPMEGVVWFDNPGGMLLSSHNAPARMLAIFRKITSLMRTPPYSSIFPVSHATRWDHFYDEILEDQITRQLHPAIAGYQAVQKVNRETAEISPRPIRFLLGLLRQLMTVCYLGMNRIQRSVVRKRLIAAEREFQLPVVQPIQ
jgi:glycosyltransferase involved in cell wall biosynthesis